MGELKKMPKKKFVFTKTVNVETFDMKSTNRVFDEDLECPHCFKIIKVRMNAGSSMLGRFTTCGECDGNIHVASTLHVTNTYTVFIKKVTLS